MPTQLLSLGVTTLILQNVVYALPSAAMIIHSNDSLEVSLSVSGPWTSLTAGVKTAANFVRCTAAITLITIKAAPRGGSASYSQVVVQDGASHYWPLNEPSGLTAVDVIGGTNGVISGGVTLNLPGAIAGSRAMKFTRAASGAIATVGNATLVGPFTVEAWIRLNSSPGFETILSVGVAFDFMFGVSTSAVPISYVNLGTPITVSVITPPVALNTWTYVVLVHTGTLASFYMDGVLIVSFAQTFSPALPFSGLVGIGANAGDGNYLDGMIDEVALYPLALTPAQIANHYALRGTPPVPTYAEQVIMDGAFGFWPLDDAGSVALDVTGTRNGTIFGTVPRVTGLPSTRTAMFFDGSSRIDIAAIPTMAPTHSVEGWFKIPQLIGNPTTRGSIIGRNATGVGNFSLSITTATGVTPARGFMSYPGIINFNGLNVLTYDNWHHIVVTYDGTNAKMYYDGVFIQSAALVYTDPGALATALQIGALTLVGASRDITLQNVALYQIELTAGQILNHYNLGIGVLASSLLIETGDHLILETADRLLLE